MHAEPISSRTRPKPGKASWSYASAAPACWLSRPQPCQSAVALCSYLHVKRWCLQQTAAVRVTMQRYFAKSLFVRSQAGIVDFMEFLPLQEVRLQFTPGEASFYGTIRDDGRVARDRLRRLLAAGVRDAHAERRARGGAEVGFCSGAVLLCGAETLSQKGCKATAGCGRARCVHNASHPR